MQYDLIWANDICQGSIFWADMSFEGKGPLCNLLHEWPSVVQEMWGFWTTLSTQENLSTFFLIKMMWIIWHIYIAHVPVVFETYFLAWNSFLPLRNIMQEHRLENTAALIGTRVEAC